LNGTLGLDDVELLGAKQIRLTGELLWWGFEWSGRQNADIASTLQLREVAMATTFWLSMGYNFSSISNTV